MICLIDFMEDESEETVEYKLPDTISVSDILEAFKSIGETEQQIQKILLTRTCCVITLKDKTNQDTEIGNTTNLNQLNNSIWYIFVDPSATW